MIFSPPISKAAPAPLRSGRRQPAGRDAAGNVFFPFQARESCLAAGPRRKTVRNASIRLERTPGQGFARERHAASCCEADWNVIQAVRPVCGSNVPQEKEDTHEKGYSALLCLGSDRRRADGGRVAGPQAAAGILLGRPYGCMPYGPPPPPPPPPPGYYPYYPRPCPPGTFWDHGACRHVPPPPHYGITIDVPPIIIR